MTDFDDLDWTRLPGIVDAVLDLMPNGAGWRAVFAEDPGLELAPADEEGWISVLHRGDVVMLLHASCFDSDSTAGLARVLVDAQVREVDVYADPFG